jgi:hypothetical protein
MNEFAAACLAPFLYGFTAIAGLAQQDDHYRENLDGGCYQLHKLYDDESQLPILLDLKTAPPDIQQFADKISRAAKDGMATMDRMRQADPTMDWEKNPLPKIEQEVRASIQGEKQHQLLFGSKGPDFVRALLVSQSEAAKYAANLDKVLADEDTNPDEQRDFRRMSAQWHALYDEVFRLLRNY